MKILIIYFSLTSNTKKMANVIEAKAKEYAEVDLFNAYCFDQSTIGQYDAIAIGSADTNNEEVDRTIIKPLVSRLANELKQMPLSLFGSYGWGGAWLTLYKRELEAEGYTVLDVVTCKLAPDEKAVLKLEKLTLNLIEETKKNYKFIESNFLS